MASELERGRQDLFPAELPPLDDPTDEAIRPLVVGIAVEDTFATHADNWYRFNVDAHDVYVIQTFDPEDEVGVDTEVRLFDSERVEQGYDDDGGSGTYSLLREELRPGRYLLRVSSYFHYPGHYSMAVTEGDAPPPAEQSPRTPPVPPPEVGVLRPGAGPVEVSLDGITDLQFEVVVDTAGLYSIETSAPESGDDVDTVIRLYADNQGEELLGEDDDSALNAYSLLWEELSAGTYHLRVSSYFGLPGRFRIAVMSASQR